MVKTSKRGRSKKKKLVIRFRFPTDKYPEPIKIILKAMNLLPDKVEEFLLKNPIMFSTEFKDFRANAMCITHETFKNEKVIIYLQHHIWDYEEKRIIEIILHEIAHIYLGHKVGNMSYFENKERYEKQEKEAEELVKKWLTEKNL